MILTLNDIKSITEGAVVIEESNVGFEFHRFTSFQRSVLDKASDFCIKATATSGVVLHCHCSGKEIKLKYKSAQGSSRTFIAFDCYIDNQLVYHYFDDPKVYESDGEFSLSLPERECEVKIYFPNLNKIIVTEFSIDGTWKPIAQKRGKLLAYGDSITQGYDAIYPSGSYALLLARHFNLELVNRGIGGERFNAKVLKEEADFMPEMVTVAYGTNDWVYRSFPVLTKKAKDFLLRLSQLYTNIPVYCLLPIWRADEENGAKGGSLAEVREFLRKEAEQYPNFKVIQPIFPQDVKLFSDGYLHPNDDGFKIMAQSIIEQIN